MSDSKKVGDINVSVGDGNTIGKIGHDVYINKRPPPLALTDEVMAAIAEQLGEPRSLVLRSTGGFEQQDEAERFATFLNDRGFTARHVGHVMMPIPPQQKPFEMRGGELWMNLAA